MICIPREVELRCKATYDIMSDYHPFGMVIEERSKFYQHYRFGFNGFEQENEIAGSSSVVDFGTRCLDVRIGRWKSVDPCEQFVGSQYMAMLNAPVSFLDTDGGWIPLVGEDGTVNYQAEKGDNLHSFATQFSITSRAAKQLFSVNGLDSYLPVEYPAEMRNGKVIPGETYYPSVPAGETLNSAERGLLKMNVRENSNSQIAYQVVAAFRYANLNASDHTSSKVDFNNIFDNTSLIRGNSSIKGLGSDVFRETITVTSKGKKLNLNVSTSWDSWRDPSYIITNRLPSRRRDVQIGDNQAVRWIVTRYQEVKTGKSPGVVDFGFEVESETESYEYIFPASKATNTDDEK